MQRYIFSLGLIFTVVFGLGCQSKVFQTLIEPQEWINIALEKGVTCTAPEMIDGDTETVGYIEITKNRANEIRRRIDVKLPERRTIHRVVFRDTNIAYARIDARLGSEGRWKFIHDIKHNTEATTEFNVGVAADALRIFVLSTTDDVHNKRDLFSDQGKGQRQDKPKLARPYIHELEVYGFIPKNSSPRDSEGTIQKD